MQQVKITHTTLKGADGKPLVSEVPVSAVPHFEAVGWKAKTEHKIVVLADEDRVQNLPGDKTSTADFKQTTTKN